MNLAILINHGVAFGGEGAAQCDGGIDFAALIEVDDTQALGAADAARRGSEISAEKSQQRRLAAAVGTDEADAQSGSHNEIQFVEQSASCNFVGDVFQFDEAFGLAVAGGKIDLRCSRAGALVQVGEVSHQFVGFVDAS